MRKIEAADVSQEFIDHLSKLETWLSIISIALQNVYKKRKQLNKRMPYPKSEFLALLCEQVMLSATIAWENFVSELFVCYINRDSTLYVQDLKTRFDSSIADRFGREIASKAVLQLGQHLNKQQVKHCLDPKQFNFVPKHSSELVQCAQKWLAIEYSKKFTSLSAKDRATIDAWYAMRNFLAHRSKASWHEMHKALNGENLYANYKLGAKARHDIGAYLKASVTKDRRMRLERYMIRMKSLASKLTK